MKSGKSGKSTQKSSPGFTWTKVLIVIGCIAFAAIMIITSLGSSWLVAVKPAKAGDTAYVDITLKDDLGRPLFTTNQKVYNSTIQSGSVIMLARAMSIPINITSSNLIDPVPAFLPGAGQVSFAFLGPEYNQIAQSLTGMKEGETKTVTLAREESYQRTLTPEQFNQMGGNFSEAKEGDLLILGFTTTPMLATDNNTTPQYALRAVPVTSKSTDNVTVNYGYSRADITLLKFATGTSGTSGADYL